MIALLLAACGGDDTPTGPKAAEIQLNLNEIALDQRESVQLVPSVVDASGTLLAGVPVSFSSSSTAIVTVSSIGLVASVGPAGSATIQVKAAGLVRTVPVTVRGVATRVTVDPNPGTIPQKATLQLVARLLDRVDAPIPNATFTYESAAPNVATVDAKGLVTSVGPSGIVNITVRTGEFAAVVPIAVTQVATRIEVSPSPANVSTGRTRSLAARLLDAVDAEIKGATFSFTSNNPSLITVSADGTITSVGPLGKGSITVSAQGTSLKVDVPVSVLANGHPNGVATLIPLPAGSYAVAAVSGSEGYASRYGGVVSRLDLVNHTATSIPGTHGGLGLAVAPSRREVYSAQYLAGAIDVISITGTPTLIATLTIPTMALDLIVSPDDRTLYASLENGTVAVFDLATRTMTTLPTSGINFLHLSLHPTKPLLYGSGNASAVYEVNLDTKATRLVPPAFAFNGQATALTSDGTFLYVANESGSVEEINLVTAARGRTFTTCSAWGLRLTPDDEQLIAACSSGQAVILDRVSGATLQTLSNGGSRRVSITADGLTALVGQANGGVTVIQ